MEIPENENQNENGQSVGPLLTRAELAGVLKVSVRTVDRMLAEGEIHLSKLHVNGRTNGVPHRKKHCFGFFFAHFAHFARPVVDVQQGCMLGFHVVKSRQQIFGIFISTHSNSQNETTRKQPNTFRWGTVSRKNRAYKCGVRASEHGFHGERRNRKN